jgi:elongation of very long chain fatty acids protein 4
MSNWTSSLQNVNMTAVVSQPVVDTFIEVFFVAEKTIAPYLDPIGDYLATEASRYIPQDYITFIENFLKTGGSPLNARLPLMNPFHVIAITAVYLTGIFLGRFIMSFLPKFEARGLMFFHNLAMVSLSAYMMVGVIQEAYNAKYTLFQNPADHTDAGFPVSIICSYSKQLAYSGSWVSSGRGLFV